MRRIAAVLNQGVNTINCCCIADILRTSWCLRSEFICCHMKFQRGLFECVPSTLHQLLPAFTMNKTNGTAPVSVARISVCKTAALTVNSKVDSTMLSSPIPPYQCLSTFCLTTPSPIRAEINYASDPARRNSTEHKGKL